MKLGCSSWSYHAAFRERELDLLEWLRVCGEELELDGVEICDVHVPTADPIYLREIKKLCADLQLTIAGIAVTNDFGPDERRSADVQKVRQWCDVAAYLGAPVVRVFAGWTPALPLESDNGRVVGLFRKVFGQRPLDRRRLWSDVMYALRRCADDAAERGVVLALQNNRTDGIVGTAQHVAQALRDVGSPWMRVCLDPEDLGDRAGVDACLPRVVQVHARLHDVREDGSDSTAHWPEILRTLKLGKYRGFVLLDYEGAEAPSSAVPRAARYMRNVLHLIDRQQLLRAEHASADVAATPATNGSEPAAEAGVAVDASAMAQAPVSEQERAAATVS